jgi:anti-anti-sigma factor
MGRQHILTSESSSHGFGVCVSSQEQSAETDPQPDPDRFGITIRNDGRDAAWITVSGELDIASAPQLAASIDALGNVPHLIVLDLRRLSFMDSTGLAEVAGAHRHLDSTGQRLVVIRGPRQIDRLLTLTGLSSVLEIADLGPAGLSVGVPEAPTG